MENHHLKMSSSPKSGAMFGIAAAVLFGLSAPLSKLLLAHVGPVLLAALLYLGAGVGLALAGLARRTLSTDGDGTEREAPLRSSDLPRVVGVVVLGGMCGPLLMLWGLQHLSGVVGSLLLNLEAPFTILLAVALFGEHLGAREAIGAFTIIAGAALLGLRPGEVHADVWGVPAVAGACLCWAIDNNLTQGLSLRDPTQVVRIKAFGAGTVMLLAALATGALAPPGSATPAAVAVAGTAATPATLALVPVLLAALLLGFASYGLSIVLHIHAVRRLGVARQAALFSSAPFVGAVVSIPLLGERPVTTDCVAALILAVGVWVILSETHGHAHEHHDMTHEHAHTHDEHHAHDHEHVDPAGVEPGVPHSHPHRHLPLVHDHPHVSDVHHHHPHG
jgi:drug/metabolite transporter (DMT)-like permease